jgi:hypothetical protein
MSQDRCEICKYSRLVGEAELEFLECRRRSPSPSDVAGDAIWPNVNSFDWCGEYEQNRRSL